MYWAAFPSHYLNVVRDVDINLLKSRKEKINLNHTRRYNLLNNIDCTEFIKEFVAVLRFVVAGEADVGFLRRRGVEIHRMADGKVGSDDQLLRPPQEEMTEVEERDWMERNKGKYIRFVKIYVQRSQGT